MPILLWGRHKTKGKRKALAAPPASSRDPKKFMGTPGVPDLLGEAACVRQDKAIG